MRPVASWVSDLVACAQNGSGPPKRRTVNCQSPGTSSAGYLGRTLSMHIPTLPMHIIKSLRARQKKLVGFLCLLVSFGKTIAIPNLRGLRSLFFLRLHFTTRGFTPTRAARLSQGPQLRLRHALSRQRLVPLPDQVLFEHLAGVPSFAT